VLTVHSPYVSHGAAFLLCGLRSHSACCLAAVRFRALFLEVQGNRAIVPPRLALCNVSRTAHSITPQVQLCALATRVLLAASRRCDLASF
jgi:hypothetical protein